MIRLSGLVLPLSMKMVGLWDFRESCFCGYQLTIAATFNYPLAQWSSEDIGSNSHSTRAHIGELIGQRAGATARIPP